MANNPELQTLLHSLNYTLPLHSNLDKLQTILTQQSINPTSQIGLYAYQFVCTQYVNAPLKNSLPNIHQQPIRIKSSETLNPQSKVNLAIISAKEKDLFGKIKHAHFMTFINLIRKSKQPSNNKNILRMQTARFHFRIKQSTLFMKNLKQNYQKSTQLYHKALSYLKQKQQCILQQYFTAWKEEALMSIAQRQFRNVTEQKGRKLSKVLLFRRLKSYKNSVRLSNALYQQHKQQFTMKIILMKVSSFFNQLRNKYQKGNIFGLQKISIHSTIKRRYFLQFVKTNNKFKLFREISQERRQKKAFKILYSKLLLKRMRNNYELRKVYFRRQQKIIFLSYLLAALEESFRRKGYEYGWMNDIHSSLLFADCKMNHTYRKYRLSIAFNAFKKQLQTQRHKISKIKQIHGRKVLHQLIYNYKIQICNQKNQHKTDLLLTRQIKVKYHEFIKSMKSDENHSQKCKEINVFVAQSKAKMGLIYLKAHYRSSQYYTSKIMNFLEQRQKVCLQTVFQQFKKAVTTQRINKRIIEEYHRYTNHQKLIKIFQCLRDYAFNQKIIKKRQRNVFKIRIRQYADELFYNLKIQLYSQMKQRYYALKENQRRVKAKRQQNSCKRAIRKLQEKKLKNHLENKLKQEYSVRFQWKMFNLLKVITARRKNEQSIANTIKLKRQKGIKTVVLDQFLTRFLLSLLLKKLDHAFAKSIIKAGFEALASCLSPLSLYKKQVKEQSNTSC